MPNPLNLFRWLADTEQRERRRQQARHDLRIFQDLCARVEPFLGPLQGQRVLDVGCGRTYPFTLLFHSLGARVTGIDIAPIPRDARAFWEIFREGGARAAASSLATRLLWDRPYYRELARAAPFPLRPRGVDLRRMDAAALAFPDGTFDLAVSNAALEHMPDVPAVLRELRRVLRPGGILHVEIHLFPSLSGGHNIPWSVPGTEVVDLGGVPPWDHLRENRFPAPVFLNRLREHEYRDMVEREFRVLLWEAEFWEPEHLLTPALEAELTAKGYTREELLKRSVVVVAQPR